MGEREEELEEQEGGAEDTLRKSTDSTNLSLSGIIETKPQTMKCSGTNLGRLYICNKCDS